MGPSQQQPAPDSARVSRPSPVHPTYPAVTLRAFAGDRITSAHPCWVISRTAEVVVLYEPAGTLNKKETGQYGGPRGRNLLPGGWDGGHRTRAWFGDGVVRVHRFDEPWSTWRWLSPERSWSDQFYVNLEHPWQRTPIGFDTGDWILDIVVRSDRTWEYKDEDELEWELAMGMVSPEWADRTWASAHRVVHTIREWGWPFTADWDSWLPAPDTPLPELAEDWAQVAASGSGE